MVHVTVLAAVVLALGLGVTGTPWQRVGRTRVEKFARRQSLPITVDNGPVVIRYLATTRRWRGGCLLLGLVGAVGWPLFASIVRAEDGANRIGINALALFAGWFAGAVVAEWRVAAAGAGPRRTATLEPRRLADYLPRSARWPAAIAWAVLAVVELGALGTFAVRGSTGLIVTLLWLALSAAVAAVVVAVGRRVLVRPQRPTEPDLIAADDALRSRSLHVLAGSSLAIAGYLLAGLVHSLTPYSSVLADGAALAIGAVGVVAAPVFGFIVATATAAPIRRERRRAVLDGVP